MSVPDGSLPVFSVDTEEEARRLLVFACETNLRGEYVARELAKEQTLDNLYAFGDRLAETYEQFHDYITKEDDWKRKVRSPSS